MSVVWIYPFWDEFTDNRSINMSLFISVFPRPPFILFPPCRHSEQRSPDASCSSRSERQSHGSQRWWDDSLHAGSQLHHGPHLSRICLCALRRHGMACFLYFVGSVLAFASLLASPLKYIILEFSYMLTDRRVCQQGKDINVSEIKTLNVRLCFIGFSLIKLKRLLKVSLAS